MVIGFHLVRCHLTNRANQTDAMISQDRKAELPGAGRRSEPVAKRAVIDGRSDDRTVRDVGIGEHTPETCLEGMLGEIGIGEPSGQFYELGVDVVSCRHFTIGLWVCLSMFMKMTSTLSSLHCTTLSGMHVPIVLSATFR